MRRVLTGMAGCVAQSALMRPVLRGMLRKRHTIAYYHFVGDSPPPHYARFYTDSTLARFRADLRRFKRDFEVVSLDAMLGPDRATPATGRPRLAVTFDDGFDLVSTGACDILQEEGVQATFFIINDCIDNRHLMWRNKLAAIGEVMGEQTLSRVHREVSEAHGLAESGRVFADSRRWDNRDKDAYATQMWERAQMPPLAEYLAEHRPYFTTQQVRGLQEQGHTIGLHTKTHCLCSGLDEAGVQTEIVEAAADLRERFGLEALPFSYPFGDRLAAKAEQALCADATVSCAMGIAGASRLDVPAYGMERAECEAGIAFPIFGRTLVTSLVPGLLGQRYGRAPGPGRT